MVVLRFPKVCVWEFTGFRVCVPVGGAPSTTTFLHAGVCGPVHDSLNFYGIHLMVDFEGFSKSWTVPPSSLSPQLRGEGELVRTGTDFDGISKYWTVPCSPPLSPAPWGEGELVRGEWRGRQTSIEVPSKSKQVGSEPVSQCQGSLGRP